MLSFDITDRNIRIIRGAENKNKIAISSAATLNIDEDIIVNGHVKDVPNVATHINGILKKNKMYPMPKNSRIIVILYLIMSISVIVRIIRYYMISTCLPIKGRK